MSQKTELKKKIKNTLTPTGRVKRTLAQIRAEREGLRQLLEKQVGVLRGLCTGKIPRLAQYGSHQNAVDYKNVLADACQCWPNNSGGITELKAKLKRVNGFVIKLREFE